MPDKPVLTVVVPCYNEIEVMDETIKQLSNVLLTLIEDKWIDWSSRILFVDDGSTDQTWTRSK